MRRIWIWYFRSEKTLSWFRNGLYIEVKRRKISFKRKSVFSLFRPHFRSFDKFFNFWRIFLSSSNTSGNIQKVLPDVGIFQKVSRIAYYRLIWIKNMAREEGANNDMAEKLIQGVTTNFRNLGGLMPCQAR